MTAPHRFRPDAIGEPGGYRPHCLDCGHGRDQHIPAPRTPARRHDHTTSTEERR